MLTQQQMVKRNKLFSFLILIVMLCSCSEEKNAEQKFDNEQVKLKYTTCFKIFKNKNYKTLQLISNGKVTNIYILYSNQKPEVNLKNVVFIKTPVKRVAALSSIYIGFINRINQLEKVFSVDNKNYIYNETIRERVNNEKINELALNGIINEEITLQTNPDVVFTYLTQNEIALNHKKLINANIPLVTLVDQLENHPLGRAEWIKFIAYFFEEELLADSLFNATERSYKSFKLFANLSKNKPKVLTEHKINDAWYVPGGKSFMATLIEDANANYCWKQDTHSGSLPLSFEEVYSKASDADFWLNVLFCKTKNDLIKMDSRYSSFKAFKEDKLFNNDLKVNSSGANDYWETGLIQPDLILSDLISILHPELKTENKTNYYRHVK
jgi:iron complex transport system substrate-binding protein